MSEKSIKRVLNERQFSTIVGLSYANVKQMRRKGYIKHLRVGRRVLYLYPEHVEIFLIKYEQVI
jgi:hypothetical protein